MQLAKSVTGRKQRAAALAALRPHAGMGQGEQVGALVGEAYRRRTAPAGVDADGPGASGSDDDGDDGEEDDDDDDDDDEE